MTNTVGDYLTNNSDGEHRLWTMISHKWIQTKEDDSNFLRSIHRKESTQELPTVFQTKDINRHSCYVDEEFRFFIFSELSEFPLEIDII